MKKLVILLAILLVGVLVITGCTKATTTPVVTTPVVTTTVVTTPVVTTPVVTTTVVTTPVVTTPVVTTPVVTTPVVTTPAGTTLTWEQALLPENLKKTITVSGQVTEILPGFSTHLLIIIGAPSGTGLEAEIYDPTLAWPGVTGTDIAAFESAWVGKTIEVTGQVIVSSYTSSLGKKRLYVLETSQVKLP